MVNGLKMIIIMPETKFDSASFAAKPTMMVATPALAKNDVVADSIFGSSDMAYAIPANSIDKRITNNIKTHFPGSCFHLAVNFL